MHLGKTSPVATTPKATKFLHFGNSSVFLGEVVVAMVIVINSVIGGVG